MKLGPDEKGAEKGEPKRSVKSVNLRVKSGGEQRASHIYDPQPNCCKKTWVEGNSFDQHRWRKRKNSNARW